MLAGAPEGPVPVPDSIARIARGRPTRPVWRNEVGGLTFAIGTGADRCFAKWSPGSRAGELGAEAARLRWAGRFVRVPEVLESGGDDDGEWIVTAALPGDNAVAARWRDDPAPAVRAIGEGLRILHDTLPVDPCPFSWSATERLADARRRARAGRLDPDRWHAVHRRLTVEDALATVSDPPAIDGPVVCHGDACAPNTLLTDDGAFCGHVDLGALGVGDRWADLAVATWSTEWNYGPGWEEPLLDAYGIDPDPARTRYYRLLWDLGP